jgi:hypothetical protein
MKAKSMTALRRTLAGRSMRSEDVSAAYVSDPDCAPISRLYLRASAPPDNQGGPDADALLSRSLWTRTG